MRLLICVLTFVFFVAPAAYCAAPPSGIAVWDQLPDSTWAPGDTLTFEQALFRVKQSSPLLAGVTHRVQSGRLMIDQAGAWPNPTLSLDVENLDGSYSGFDRSETTLRLSHEFPISGLRSNRRGIAISDADAATLDARNDAFGLYLAVAHRYAKVAHAERHLALVEEARQLLTGLAEAAGERVRVGAALVADRLLGEAAVERANIAHDDAQTEVLSARRSLASLWGAPDAFAEPIRTRSLPRVDSDSLLARSAHAPAVLGARIDLQRARANQALERSLRFPSISADAGVRRIEADDAGTFVIGVGVPLPLFDRRGSGMEAEAARARGLEMTAVHLESETRREVAERVARLERLIDRARRTDTTLIPAQSAALEALRDAYGIGRVSYSDLLESQRVYIQLQLERNDVDLSIAEETIAIEALLGTPIEEPNHD